ncbi:MAG TPA: DNA-binding response regulator, partial [Bacteroidales bacterium]|nr:DNA-binding response regulator [Bacteroidales bacterium]
MNVLIIENEKPAILGLRRLLKKIEPSINISGTTESVESTINWFQKNPFPDLIFMDIQLDDGLCFE